MRHLVYFSRSLIRQQQNSVFSFNKPSTLEAPNRITTLLIKSSVHTSTVKMSKALVLGVYQSEASKDSVTLTDNAHKFDQQVDGVLKKLVDSFTPAKNKSKIFYGLHPDYPVVAVVGIGPKDAAYNPLEDIDEKLENVRQAIAVGAKSVRGESNINEVVIDDCGVPQAASEGANLALWYFDELKSQKYKKKELKISPLDPSVKDEFAFGEILAISQNMCRRFAEMPANHMTPTIFGRTVLKNFENLPEVKVTVRDKVWAESKKMESFLSVAKGSAEPPKFVEVHYNNKPSSKPFVLVGKGVCFDSGGISIKQAANMDKMRYDMGGAANVVSTIYALASTKAQVNVIGLTPLCENLPSGTANKPGGVVTAMNGKTIQVDNTDAEGRLILADALCYAHEFDPQAILDIATLTGAMNVALGSSATGVFTPNGKLFELMQKAGSQTGDRVWRMPLYSHYKPQVTDSQLADCVNIGKQGGQGGCCTAAAFLNEFVQNQNWLHLDIAGVMESKDEYPYYGKGMSGRPVRTLYLFLAEFFKTN